MSQQSHNFSYFQEGSFSSLFAQDIKDGQYGFILNYPATASWTAYPNNQKYLIQDGSDEDTKVSYDILCQKEPWKNLAVLGDDLTGIIFRAPRKILIDYWQEQFGFKYTNIEVLERKVYLDYLNQSERYQKIITLFPFDRLLPEKHAVNPDNHYYLLSKISLDKIGFNCPKYQCYDLNQTSIYQINFPDEYPYLVKVSHGLSGEGTYIIRSADDLEYCWRELEKYQDHQMIKDIVVSDFVANQVQNYCVQFYVNKQGEVTLIGATTQMVSPEGKFLGGLIHYEETDMSKFVELITKVSEFAHAHDYFGVIGCDALEDIEGKLHVIDVNYRVNGSTPLCLQRHRLMSSGKEVAKYSGDYQMNGTLDSILLNLKEELERKEFTILSALEKVKYGKIYCDIYGVVAGETTKEMLLIEEKLQDKGLKIVG